MNTKLDIGFELEWLKLKVVLTQYSAVYYEYSVGIPGFAAVTNGLSGAD